MIVPGPSYAGDAATDLLKQKKDHLFYAAGGKAVHICE
jgi:hypothetical protein